MPYPDFLQRYLMAQALQAQMTHHAFRRSQPFREPIQPRETSRAPKPQRGPHAAGMCSYNPYTDPDYDE